MINDIKMTLVGMEEGTSIREQCPFCGGKERTLSITRNFDNGVFNCYRASCGAKGFIPLNPLALPKTTVKKEKKGKGSLHGELADAADDYLASKYDLSKEILRLNPCWIARNITFVNGEYHTLLGDGLWLYLRDFNYTTWGVYTKKLVGYNWQNPNKTWTSIIEEVDFPYYVPTIDRSKPYVDNVVYFVEDPISALKVAQLGYQSVALLGTHFKRDHVLELVKQKFRGIVWMLDPDTWQNPAAKSKAESLASQVGPILQHKIVYMDRDPKDTDIQELEDICHRNSLFYPAR